MKFKDAVENTPEIEDALHHGLQALRRRDRTHVTASDTRRITGSVDIDTSLRRRYPQEPRWDYAIGHLPKNSRKETVYWIEIHPAGDGEVHIVIAKLNWLKQWLDEKAPYLDAMRREFIWLSSGRTTFTLSSPQKKRFAQLGLHHRGRAFEIPDHAHS